MLSLKDIKANCNSDLKKREVMLELTSFSVPNIKGGIKTNKSFSDHDIKESQRRAACEAVEGSVFSSLGEQSCRGAVGFCSSNTMLPLWKCEFVRAKEQDEGVHPHVGQIHVSCCQIHWNTECRVWRCPAAVCGWACKEPKNPHLIAYESFLTIRVWNGYDFSLFSIFWTALAFSMY